ncbi:DUF551 domain-containing protein [Klebsiella pneumoniae]|uniref:DUF551 domain-containing protein n=1 Tax=Klebsiella pneumoniae TaxID=573 RepID=UPI001D18D615|nr:DUF551 domain-containing protein [Klebsiella pneumoniae]MCC5734735.1 DUF551 domain-containing protein [Klebsiella pneumoniae]MDO0730538.1 DUF551 domain-containing protein [Klebsiella pneumoniae]MDW1214200.1 DUF551 domain-containing protein [Klebsiella pneumoniae]MDX4360980.1 DUF551 domain-containing protein [Klebsiella pneumoniae]MDX4547066.1 DUF551 domain-containing protein [Klebsiella pneumoniae]
MTKSTITREESVQAVFDLKAGYRLGFADIEILKRVARIALAAMDSEPVAWLLSGGGAKNVVCFDSGNAYADPLREVTPLYRHAQPAPTCESITITDDMAYAFHHALTDSMIGADDVEEIKTGLRAVFANLTAPVVSAEYPDRLPCSVLLEPGLRFGKGIKTSTMLAALARRAVHESDMAALSPEERVEFQARIEEFKALIAQPAPAVPEEITIETATIIAYGLPTTNIGAIFKAGHDACRAARLKAQPQNAPQNIPEIIPGWIPVSEKMPPSRHEVLVGRWWGEKPRWCCKWATYIPGHPDSQSSGWLIPGGSWTPTHWMELPAAPQGVKP